VTFWGHFRDGGRMLPWRINQLLNALALLAAVLLLGVLVTQFVWSLIDDDRDVHGLVRITSILLGLFLLVPLSLLTSAAVALYRRRRVGFVYQLFAGAVVGLYGVLISSGPAELPTPRLVGLGLGALLAAPAVAGLFATRRGARRRE
jgi:peptidoglycan/LPS O-acetylase OafA/YrhL